VVKEWLDRDPRLRASIVVPMQNTEYAVDEIERCAKDRRFVQILVLAMQETPLGRRHLLADLRRRRAPRPAARHPCRLELPPFHHVAGLPSYTIED
jgi:predicted TIM-barrel fold metal-dependent hydrolase